MHTLPGYKIDRHPDGELSTVQYSTVQCELTVSRHPTAIAPCELTVSRHPTAIAPCELTVSRHPTATHRTRPIQCNIALYRESQKSVTNWGKGSINV